MLIHAVYRPDWTTDLMQAKQIQPNKSNQHAAKTCKQPKHARNGRAFLPRHAKLHINTTSPRRKTLYVFVRVSTGVHLTGAGLGVGAARTGARTAALGAGAGRAGAARAAGLGAARAAGLGAARAAAKPSTCQQVFFVLLSNLRGYPLPMTVCLHAKAGPIQ
jgi:hypothetical protein